MGLEKITQIWALSIALEKANVRLSAPSLALQDQEKAYNLKSYPSRWNKYCGAGISIENFWKTSKPLKGQKVFFSWSQSIKTGGCDHFFECKDTQHKTSRNMKNQVNIVPPKKHKFAGTNLKEMVICDSPNKESREGDARRRRYGDICICIADSLC